MDNESQLRLISRRGILKVTFRRAPVATYTNLFRDCVSRLVWHVYTHTHIHRATYGH